MGTKRNESRAVANLGERSPVVERIQAYTLMAVQRPCGVSTLRRRLQLGAVDYAQLVRRVKA